MATSIKLSELQSLANLTLTDLLLVTDAETSTSRKITFQNLRDSFNLTEIPGYDAYNTNVVGLVSDETTARETAVAALQTLIDALQTEADARNTRITTLETTVDNLDIDLSPETLNSINELADALGDDANFITTVNNSIAAVQADVDQNEADADAAIAALQTTIDNLDIDIAPETLNSIDELAAAMGDDPAFLTTLQARVTTIENDNATQTELDAVNQSIQISLGAAAQALDDYKAYVDDMNLQLVLAYDTPLYVDTLFGG